jgi:hypothetical protein
MRRLHDEDIAPANVVRILGPDLTVAKRLDLALTKRLAYVARDGFRERAVGPTGKNLQITHVLAGEFLAYKDNKMSNLSQGSRRENLDF